MQIFRVSNSGIYAIIYMGDLSNEYGAFLNNSILNFQLR